MGRGPIPAQTGQHIDHAAYRPSGLAVGIVAVCAQIGHGVKSAVKVTGTIYQQ
jgi:hypothetical protein